MLFYGGIYTLGDLSQQWLRLRQDSAKDAPPDGTSDGAKDGTPDGRKDDRVDFLHAARIGLVTLTFFGPGFHKLYRAMDR